MAATSTHLGRGDNWAIPDFSLEKKTLQTGLKDVWRTAIIGHYQNGLKLCKSGFGSINGMKTKIDASGAPIPDIFLEALTFEGSFLDKMWATLGVTGG
jgi:hypothetical protein